jgi:hypothetical protein
VVLVLQANDRPDYGQRAESHFVSLPGDERAALEQVNNGSWRLLIYRPGSVTDQGLFGTTHDILTLLQAEHFAMPFTRY